MVHGKIEIIFISLYYNMLTTKIRAFSSFVKLLKVLF